MFTFKGIITKITYCLFLICISNATGNQFVNATGNQFKGTISPIPDHIKILIVGKSWNTSCPVPIKDLSYLTITHWGFDGNIHEGEIIVHKKLAQEVIDIFKDLFEAQFPIEKMRLIDHYDADDERSVSRSQRTLNTWAMCRIFPLTHRR